MLTLAANIATCTSIFVWLIETFALVYFVFSFILELTIDSAFARTWMINVSSTPLSSYLLPPPSCDRILRQLRTGYSRIHANLQPHLPSQQTYEQLLKWSRETYRKLRVSFVSRRIPSQIPWTKVTLRTRRNIDSLRNRIDNLVVSACVCFRGGSSGKLTIASRGIGIFYSPRGSMSVN